MSFRETARQRLANRVLGNMTNRTRRPRPGMNKGGPRPGVRPGPGMNMARPRPRPGMSTARPRPAVMSPVKRGGTAATGGMPTRMGFSGGGEALKTPIAELPNEGLKKLAKTKKGKDAVIAMGYAGGGEAIAKGSKCPHRGKVRGTGIAISGVGFKGVS